MEVPVADVSDIPVPGGEVVARSLQFIWLVDNSGSMSGSKISTVNQAIRDALPFIRDAVSKHPEVEVNMRAISFESVAQWHVGPVETPLTTFVWPDLKAMGSTATHEAIDMLAGALDVSKMPKRNAAPVCILVSDGYCDDSDAYDAAIARLKATPFGKKAVRLAIAVQDQSGFAEDELIKFVSHPEIGVLKADTPQQLVAYIKWASVAATVATSKGKSSTNKQGADLTNVVIQPPAFNFSSSSGDVF
jgi:uncharacterized protein YegL